MIAHVAAASEARGRVLLWLDPDVQVSRKALEAAVHVAAAYAADIETVVMDGPTLGDVDDIPHAHVSHLGKGLGRHAGGAVIDFRERLAERQRRSVDWLAKQAGVAVTHTSAPGDPIDLLAELCLVRGPWNMVALGRLPGGELAPAVSAILANVSGATGVICAGQRDAPASDDVAVIVEDMDRMPSMLRAAERLAMASGQIHVAIAAETAGAYREIEAQLRLFAADGSRIVFLPGGPNFGVAGAFDAALFRLRPCFVITRFAGAQPGDARALTRLAALSAGPLLLVR